MITHQKHLRALYISAAAELTNAKQTSNFADAPSGASASSFGVREMNEKLTVSFFGHRLIEDYHTVESKLYELLRIIIQKENREIEFLVGRNGDFDLMVTSVIRKLKKEFCSDNVYLNLVMPYETAELRDNAEAFEDYYDSVEICEASADCNFKYAIVARNRDMIDRSDVVIVYVKNKSGGAFQALKYAQKSKKRIINLYIQDTDNSF